MFAWAQPPAAAGQGDPVAGRAVAVGGKEANVTPCFTCHGLDGAGDASGAFPRLAGQVPFYMYKQLMDYAAGTRPNALMGPIARELSEKQMADVSLYYGALDAPAAPVVPAAPPELLDLGRRIAEEGLPKAGITACALCHGRGNAGAGPLFPYLAGQYAPYTQLQLTLWKADVRDNDGLDVMEGIARRMSADDIRAVSAYLATLPPPGAPPGRDTADAR